MSTETTTKTPPLHDVADRWQQFAALVDEEGDAIPQEVLHDQWEALEGEFDQKAVRVWEFAKSLDPEIEALDKEIKRLQKRKKSREGRRDSLKTYLALHMERIGRKKVDAMNWTLTLTQGAMKVVIDSEDDLPPDLVETDIRYVVDKKGLKARLEAEEALRQAGKDVEATPGAHLEQAPPHIRES